MSDRFLKHTPSGQVFIYQNPFAQSPDFVEVADAIGTPFPEALEGEFEAVNEPEAPVEAPVEALVKKRAAKMKPAEPESDTTKELEALLAAQEALNANASRGA